MTSYTCTRNGKTFDAVSYTHLDVYKRQAVDHLSFTAEKGKIYGFLGPNGAGKSTTMNMMTGYLASTSGEVLIDGHDILKESEKAKKHIGYLPEVPTLYMEMTPYEQLHFAAELRGLARGEREACVVQVLSLIHIYYCSF